MGLRISRSKLASFSILTVVIGTVIVGIVLISIGYKIVVGSGKLSNEQKCYLSIFAADQASALKRESLETLDFVPNFECVPDEIVIHPSDVKRSRRGRIDDDLVKGKIAEELYKCWSMVGQGELNPFQAAWPQSDKTFCMTCATIEFSEDFIEEAARQRPQPYRLEGLRYWMMTRFPKGQEKTFYEYVMKRTPSTEDIQRARNSPDLWPFTNANQRPQKYFVVWRFERQDRKLEGLLLMAVGGLLGGFPGYFLGFGVAMQMGTVFTMQGVYLLPQEQLSGTIRFEGADEAKETCTIMVN